MPRPSGVTPGGAVTRLACPGPRLETMPGSATGAPLSGDFSFSGECRPCWEAGSPGPPLLWACLGPRRGGPWQRGGSVGTCRPHRWQASGTRGAVTTAQMEPLPPSLPPLNGRPTVSACLVKGQDPSSARLPLKSKVFSLLSPWMWAGGAQGPLSISQAVAGSFQAVGGAACSWPSESRRPPWLPASRPRVLSDLSRGCSSEHSAQCPAVCTFR